MLECVQLRDCPHNGKKDVVDKTIIIDMVFYAIDRPLTTTILLISGDRDYSYAISTLHNRGYTVKLLAPAGCLHSNLPLLADVLDWETVLGLRPRKTNVVEIGVSTVDPTPVMEPDEASSGGSEPKNNQEDEEDSGMEPIAKWGSLAASNTPTAFDRYDLNFPPLPTVPDDWAASPSPPPAITLQPATRQYTYSAPAVPLILEDLVAELEALKLTGYSNPLWGMVAEGLIKRAPNFLAKAGVE